jgi:FtsH-binding integral membrane protein
MTAITYPSATEINSAMGRVYGLMSVAVLVSMFVSYFVGTSPELLALFFTGFTKWIVIFAPLAFIFLVPVVINSGIGAVGASLVLYGFAAVMGLSFSTIFAVYQMGSIVTAFMGAGVLFAVMSFYGYFTKQSLDSIGKYLFVGLIAIIIASIINLFVGSGPFAMLISAIAIVIFLGLTAYDTQRLREELSSGGDYKVEVMGALSLYLNFINLFIQLLSLFGTKKE